jgi:hypothetical protein
VQPFGGHAATRAEDERPGEVHQIAAVPGHRFTQARAGQADPQSGIDGDGERRYPHHWVREHAVRSWLSVGGLRSNDEWLVAPVHQVLSDAECRVCDTVDVRREGLCDICDPHAYRFAGDDPRDLRHAVTCKKTMRDISALNVQAK